MQKFFKSLCEKISLVFRFLNGLVNIAVFYYYWIAALIILLAIQLFCGIWIWGAIKIIAKTIWEAL